MFVAWEMMIQNDGLPKHLFFDGGHHHFKHRIVTRGQSVAESKSNEDISECSDCLVMRKRILEIAILEGVLVE